MNIHYCGCDVKLYSAVEVGSESDVPVISDEHATTWEALYQTKLQQKSILLPLQDKKGRHLQSLTLRVFIPDGVRDPDCDHCKRALGPLYHHKIKGNRHLPVFTFDFSGPHPHRVNVAQYLLVSVWSLGHMRLIWAFVISLGR